MGFGKSLGKFSNLKKTTYGASDQEAAPRRGSLMAKEDIIPTYQSDGNLSPSSKFTASSRNKGRAKVKLNKLQKKIASNLNVINKDNFYKKRFSNVLDRFSKKHIEDKIFKNFYKKNKETSLIKGGNKIKSLHKNRNKIYCDNKSKLNNLFKKNNNYNNYTKHSVIIKKTTGKRKLQNEKFDFKKSKNENKYKKTIFNPHMDTSQFLKCLVEENKTKNYIKLYKLTGVKTRSIKAVHQALINHFQFKNEDIGGLTYLEGPNTWVFLADPSEVEKKEFLSRNEYGVSIEGWTPEELSIHMTKLTLYAGETAKNVRERNKFKKACKKLVSVFIKKDYKEVEEVIYLTSKLNKSNFIYENFVFLKNLKIKATDISYNNNHLINSGKKKIEIKAIPGFYTRHELLKLNSKKILGKYKNPENYS